MIIFLVLLLALLFFGLGFTLHLLWVVAAIVLFVWIIGLALGRGSSGATTSISGEPSGRRASRRRSSLAVRSLTMKGRGRQGEAFRTDLRPELGIGSHLSVRTDRRAALCPPGEYAGSVPCLQSFARPLSRGRRG